jgi:hypothetical protein
MLKPKPKHQEMLAASVDFHKNFCRVQEKASELADLFNRRVNGPCYILYTQTLTLNPEPWTPSCQRSMLHSIYLNPKPW